MHEMSCVARFAGLAQEAAEREGLKEISAVHIRVGRMTGYLPEYLEKYYPEVVSGTPLEGSSLIVDDVPVRVRCTSCGTEYEPERVPDRKCPSCGGYGAHILTGRELELVSVTGSAQTDAAAADDRQAGR